MLFYLGLEIGVELGIDAVDVEGCILTILRHAIGKELLKTAHVTSLVNSLLNIRWKSSRRH